MFRFLTGAARIAARNAARGDDYTPAISITDSTVSSSDRPLSTSKNSGYRARKASTTAGSKCLPSSFSIMVRDGRLVGGLVDSHGSHRVEHVGQSHDPAGSGI